MRVKYLNIVLALMMVQHVCAQNIPNGVTTPGAATPKRTPIYTSDLSPYYQRSFVPLKPMTDSTLVNMNATVDDVAITTLYGDEMGRPVQAVSAIPIERPCALTFSAMRLHSARFAPP